MRKYRTRVSSLMPQRIVTYVVCALGIFNIPSASSCVMMMHVCMGLLYTDYVWRLITHGNEISGGANLWENLVRFCRLNVRNESCRKSFFFFNLFYIGFERLQIVVVFSNASFVCSTINNNFAKTIATRFYFCSIDKLNSSTYHCTVCQLVVC